MTDSPLRILLHGATGRMGAAVLRLASADARFRIVAAASSRGGEDLGSLTALSGAALARAERHDVAIDFSTPAAFDIVLDECRRRGCALVSGTTGLDAGQQRALDEAAATIPVLWSANFSPGVAVLAELARRAVQALPDWDCDIVETHHRDKRDAPSGTALVLGGVVGTIRGAEPAIASLRAGDVVGDHSVQLSGPGERLELVHRAGDRDIFARGALRAALWLARRPPGRYTMADCLGLD